MAKKKTRKGSGSAGGRGKIRQTERAERERTADTDRVYVIHDDHGTRRSEPMSRALCTQELKQRGYPLGWRIVEWDVPAAQ